MSMKTYNKLVRDKIPEIIEKDNKRCVTHIMNDKDYLDALNAKLSEELKEYLESGEVEELADLTEVILAIVDQKNVSREDFEKIRQSKVNIRGAFKEKILLEKVYEDGE